METSEQNMRRRLQHACDEKNELKKDKLKLLKRIDRQGMTIRELSFELEDEGLWLHTDAGKIAVHFDAERYRPLEVPILLGDTAKIDQLGFQIQHTVGDIVRDQINHYLSDGSGANTLAVFGRPSD